MFAPFAEAMKAAEFNRAIEFLVHIWVDGPKRRPDEVDPVVRERVREMYTGVLRCSRDGGRQADLLAPPAYCRQAEIHVPTLVVVGDGDVPGIVEAADYLERNIAGARKVVIPRLAHVLNMERPTEINQIILDFLRKQVGRSVDRSLTFLTPRFDLVIINLDDTFARY